MDEQLFLTAVMENKLPVVEKYMADGGNPNAADNVREKLLKTMETSLIYGVYE